MQTQTLTFLRDYLKKNVARDLMIIACENPDRLTQFIGGYRVTIKEFKDGDEFMVTIFAADSDAEVAKAYLNK